MAYTQQQITDEVNRILSSGGSWADVLSEAQQYGIPVSQLPPQPSQNSWLSNVQQFGDLSKLPPELWSQLQGPNASSVVYDGYRINPIMGNTGGGGENNYSGGQQVQSYSVTPDSYSTTPGDNIGKSNALFNADGTYGGNDTITGFDSSDSFGHWLGLMALAAGAGYGASSLFGAGTAGASSLGTNGAFLGEGVASGVPAWDTAAANAGLTLGGGGATAGDYLNGSDLMSDTFTSNGGYGAGGFGSTGLNPALAGDYVNGSDVMSDTFDANGGAGAGGFGGGTGAYVAPTGSTPHAPTGGTPPVTPTLPGVGTVADWTKLLGALTTVIGGAKATGSPSPAPAPAQPFDYGPARYMPPGWRTDRPMYVPGQDEIPEGWLGAGGTTNG